MVTFESGTFAAPLKLRLLTIITNIMHPPTHRLLAQLPSST
jgi:hypothetical protein